METPSLEPLPIENTAEKPELMPERPEQIPVNPNERPDTLTLSYKQSGAAVVAAAGGELDKAQKSFSA